MYRAQIPNVSLIQFLNERICCVSLLVYHRNCKAICWHLNMPSALPTAYATFIKDV